jgi:hypothetical protein
MFRRQGAGTEGQGQSSGIVLGNQIWGGEMPRFFEGEEREWSLQEHSDPIDLPGHARF